MMRIFHAEWLKLRHTPIPWMIFGFPVMLSMVLIWYFSGRPWIAQEDGFESFFMVWTGILLPAGSAVLCGYLAHEERMAGNYQGILGRGTSRFRLFLGKYLMAMSSIGICVLLSAGVLCAGTEWMLLWQGDRMSYVLASCWTLIGMLPVCALYLWISFAWGMGASVGIGMGGLLAASLIGGTGLGNHVWAAVPWAWPVRMALAVRVCLNGELIRGTAGAARQILSLGTAVSFAGFVFLLFGSAFWFSRWEGRNIDE